MRWIAEFCRPGETLPILSRFYTGDSEMVLLKVLTDLRGDLREKGLTILHSLRNETTPYVN